MKTLQVTTKASALQILTDSLFNPVNGKSLNKMKYCNGKYKPESFKTGSDIEVSDSIHAIYKVIQKDADGRYSRLMCICE